MNNTVHTIAIIAAALLLSTTAHAAGTAINETGETPHASAILDAASTTKGFLSPRMTALQRGLIASPAAGLMVYQTDAPAGLYLYNGTAWKQVVSGTVGNATVADVLSGKTFSNGTTTGLTGTMPNNGAANFTPAATAVPVPAGYYSGGQVNTDANLVSDNIKSGVSIFGVAGKPSVVETASATATAGDLQIGKTAYVSGSQITGTAYPAPVPKTGQTTCYGAGNAATDCTNTTGQDGNNTKGVAWPYPRFTANAGTVKDNLTGLIWLQNANCAQATRDWPTAITDVQSLNNTGSMNGTYCGDTSKSGSYQTDWRLPNVKELYGLVDLQYYNPALSDTTGTAQWVENNPFTSVQTDRYWSSTSFAGAAASAWYVDMIDGFANYDVKTGTRYVWPVRGGQ